MKGSETHKDLILAITKSKKTDTEAIQKLFFKHPDANGRIPRKSTVLASYKQLKKQGKIKLSKSQEKKLLKAIQMKKTRTLSGVTPVTVLTKPFPCLGQCVFCPNDVRMPKSYISAEPGAQRAAANKFDPYFQTYNRLVAYHDIGHPTDKVELIILGGTWSSYFEDYQVWFVKRCFDAMNDFNPQQDPETLEPGIELPYDTAQLDESRGNYNRRVARAQKLTDYETASWKQLVRAQRKNEKAKSRCVGLVVETRPDCVSPTELIRIRRLGATKIQIGIQSLDDKVLKKNKRGHTVTDSAKALNLIRQAGFKIHAHWMANLYGSTPGSDIRDFKKLFKNPSFKPDELKVYPCALVESSALMKYYTRGDWKPYTEKQLLKVLKSVFVSVPRYCRITRVVRDISSDDIVAGNKKTNFRQIVERAMKEEGLVSKDIRAREIRDKVPARDLHFKVVRYDTAVSTECFLEYLSAKDTLVGFLRLSLPKEASFVAELGSSAIIREVHVYGRSLSLGVKDTKRAQHRGLGKSLIAHAKDIALQEGYRRLAVISAIGTREYYKNLGFTQGELYQHLDLV